MNPNQTISFTATLKLSEWQYRQFTSMLYRFIALGEPQPCAITLGDEGTSVVVGLDRFVLSSENIEVLLREIRTVQFQTPKEKKE